LFLGFYEIYFIEFLLFGLLLLIGSIVCIKLFNVYQLLLSYNSFLKTAYNLAFLKINVFFSRKQNVFAQGGQHSGVKVFKRKE
jgi:hypothetical protein